MVEESDRPLTPDIDISLDDLIDEAMDNMAVDAAVNEEEEEVLYEPGAEATESVLKGFHSLSATLFDVKPDMEKAQKDQKEMKTRISELRTKIIDMVLRDSPDSFCVDIDLKNEKDETLYVCLSFRRTYNDFDETLIEEAVLKPLKLEEVTHVLNKLKATTRPKKRTLQIVLGEGEEAKVGVPVPIQKVLQTIYLDRIKNLGLKKSSTILNIATKPKHPIVVPTDTKVWKTLVDEYLDLTFQLQELNSNLSEYHTKVSDALETQSDVLAPYIFQSNPKTHRKTLEIIDPKSGTRLSQTFKAQHVSENGRQPKKIEIC